MSDAIADLLESGYDLSPDGVMPSTYHRPDTRTMADVIEDVERAIAIAESEHQITNSGSDGIASTSVS